MRCRNVRSLCGSIAGAILVLGGCGIAGGSGSAPPPSNGRSGPPASVSPSGSQVRGSTATGWPVAVPPSYDEATFAFSADGGLFAAAYTEITAYDPSGRVRPGWPIPSPVDAPIRAIAVASDGSLLVARDHQVSDISLAGRAAAGWPIPLAGPFGGMWTSPGSIVLAEQPAGGQGVLHGLMLAESQHVAWTTPVDGGPAAPPAFGPDGTFYLPVSQGDHSDTSIVAVT